MARTEEGRLLTVQQRQQQISLRGRVGRDIAGAWRAFNPESIRSYGSFVAIATAIINEGHSESSAIATAYYNLFKQAEGAGGPIRTVGALPLDSKNVIDSLRATGLTTALASLFSGDSVGAASAKGLVAVIGSATRLTLNGGRGALLRTMGNDGQVQGWVRTTSGSPCHFCAMLASRGPVFESRRAAVFRAHDYCVCSLEPHYEGSAWPGNARNYERMWNRSVEVANERGEDPAVVFRRRIEGKPDPPLDEG